MNTHLNNKIWKLNAIEAADDASASATSDQ